MKLIDLLNEIQYSRYTVGYFHPNGEIEGGGQDGMMADFGNYNKAAKYAKELHKDDPDYIYVVMDEKHVEPYPILVVGKETPKFKAWIKSLKK
tara:strand:- start:68 stop:346 length:279 start_codon:yes stop_codon:yes gene_type:complete